MNSLTINARPSWRKVGKAFDNVSKSKVIEKELKVFAFRIERESKKAPPTPSDTGTMRRSIFTKFGKMGLSASVGAGVIYAPFVHFGTRRMAARPFMKWGLEAAKRKLYGGLEVPFTTSIDREFVKEFRRI